MDKRQLGGVSVILSNAALFANGLIALTHGHTPDIRNAGAGRMISGLLYGGTGAIITNYGNLPVEKQLEKLKSKLAAHLKQEGVPLDAQQLQLADAEARKNWFAKLEDFAYDHPIETANTYNAIASTGMLGSGLIRRSSGDTAAGNANIINYLMVLTGTFASMVPELTPEQIAKKG